MNTDDMQKPSPTSKPAETVATDENARGGKVATLRKNPRGWLVLIIAVGSVIAFFGIAAGAGFGFWGWQAGLGALKWTGVAALVALVIAIIGIVVDRRQGRKTRWPLMGLGMLVSLGFIGYLASYIITASSLPAIHDITTDLADPPQFSQLEIRADNWDNIPGADKDEMRGMNPRQRWATVHQDAYADIRSVRIDQPVVDVMAKAQRLAKDRGWKVVSFDPATGHMEATDTISLFRFKDDVVIRARPAENGSASIIDMRSVSRVGVHDLGVNAKRVRQFLSDLSGTTTAASR